MEGNFNGQRATNNEQRATNNEQLTTGNVGCHVSLIGDAWSMVNGCQSSSHFLPYRPVEFPRGISAIGVVLWIIGDQAAQEATPISRCNRFSIPVRTQSIPNITFFVGPPLAKPRKPAVHEKTQHPDPQGHSTPHTADLIGECPQYQESIFQRIQ